MKISLCLLTCMLMFISLSADYDPDKLNFLPLSQYSFLEYGQQSVNSTSLGFAAIGPTQTIVAMYSQHNFSKKPLYNISKKYHSIEILYDKVNNSKQYLAILKSESDSPFAELNTFQVAFAYGYRILDHNNLSVIFGAGIGISDFGVEFDEGKPLPAIPVPLIRMKYNSDLLSAKFDFLTGPNLDICLFPNHKIKLITECRLDQFRDARDVFFNSSLCWRPFSKDSKLGDFAGIKAGICNEGLGFDLKNDNGMFELQYYSLFTEIDLSLLKITAGKHFNGKERYYEEIFVDMKSGYHFSAQLMIPL